MCTEAARACLYIIYIGIIRGNMARGLLLLLLLLLCMRAYIKIIIIIKTLVQIKL